MFERRLGSSGEVVQPDPSDGKQAVIASVSGGKDSTALSLWLTERGIEHRRVCMDTGWEHPDWAVFVEDYLQDKLGPIEMIQSTRGGMEDWIRHKGIFPSRKFRWCTELLKVLPFKAYLAAQEYADEPIVSVGVRAEESMKRRELPEWDYWPQAKAFMWRPLINWTEDDVIEIHKRHGVRPNPLYLRGSRRVGCWPCINARKAEIRLVADQTPERIELIRKLENLVGDATRSRIEARGETQESVDPTFFHGSGGVGHIPIDNVVAWSRTSRGGKQTEMFASETEGCARWGLCEGIGSPAWARAEEEAPDEL